ncbi:MAG TPA: sn-glycerol-1-phosphate dehydrogenase [Herpetosiphonaceae bacterium]|nr:sn-glycerol-1-phosphate dehydrogenase [Herpetosiphonaceae bacterium]
MDNKGIEAALRETSDTRCLLIGAGALTSVDATFEQCFGQQPAVVVADENTFSVPGQTVQEQLRAAGRAQVEPIIFLGTPTLYADFENVLFLETRLRAHDAIPIVVGSGTLNDITKLASHRAGRQYMCVGTAASMDGYTAFGAAITKDGFKQTMSCPAPRAVLADLDVLVQAPPQMNSTGYGDLFGKITAGADWLLADALEIEPIDPRAWSLVQDSLRSWTAHPERLHAGDPRSIEHLLEGLIMAGVAMQISASSRPASGSEHRFSHLWEMQALGQGHAAVPHGFKVGVGTIAAAALYERVLTRDLSNLDIEALCRSWPSREEVEWTVRQAHDIPQLAENAVEESLAKYIDAGQLHQRLTLLRERWPTIRERLQAQLMTAEEARAMLQAAGCPTHPDEIGVSMETLKESYTLARTIRSRYTVLDLVNESGVLAECVHELFAPGGFWSRSTVSGRPNVHR